MLRETWIFFAIATVVFCGPSNGVSVESSVESDSGRLEQLRSLFQEKLYDEAQTRGREILAQLAQENRGDSVQAARVLDILVDALWYGGKADDPETLEIAERSLDIKQRHLEPDDTELIVSTENLAYLHSRAERYEEAKVLFESTLSIKQKNLPGDSLELEKTATALGHALIETGNYEEAKTYYEYALQVKIDALGPEDPNRAPNLYNIARAHRSMGNYAEARTLFIRALEIKEDAVGADHPELTGFLNGLAILLDHTGDFAGARMRHERILQIRKRELGSEHLNVASALNNLALLLRNTGDFSGARELFEEALGIREKNLEPNHLLIAQSWHNIAVVSAKLEDFDRARELFERTLKIRQDALGTDHPVLATTQLRYAQMLCAIAEYREARPFYESALRILTINLQSEHRDIADCLYGLGLIEHRTGSLDKARNLYTRALGAREASLGPQHPVVAEVRASLAELELTSGHAPLALEYALRAEEISANHLLLTARTLSERQALSYASIRSSGFDVMASLIVAGHPDVRQVWDAVIRSRALVLDEMARRHRLVGGKENAEIAALVADLESTSRILAGLLVRGHDPKDPERSLEILRNARKEKERAERVLAERSLIFRKEIAQRGIGIEEVVDHLPADSALVAFVRYNRREVPRQEGKPRRRAREAVPSYLALVVRGRERDFDVLPLGSEEEIHALVAGWRREVGHSLQAEHAYRRAGEALRQRVWDPVAAVIDGANRVFIVPDGMLNLVSFHSLPDAGNGYLIESGPLIHFLSSERDLASTAAQDGEGRGLLAIGGPDFDERGHFAALRTSPVTSASDQDERSSIPSYRGSRAACGSFKTTRFSHLSGAVREAKEIAGLWKRSQASDGVEPVAEVLSGSAANESVFKLRAPGRRILHVATHGFFLGDTCRLAMEPSRGIGGMSPASQASPAGIPEENPLLLSGLAFAGANHRDAAGPDEDDGILTAEEVAAMDLAGVELAVLSACDTGIGEVRVSEGVFGLRRAFRIAGVGTLVMSLWSVDDSTTRDWMHTFYENHFTRNLGAAEAAAKSSLELLLRRRKAEESTHPFFWAGFVVVGH